MNKHPNRLVNPALYYQGQFITGDHIPFHFDVYLINNGNEILTVSSPVKVGQCPPQVLPADSIAASNRVNINDIQ